MPRLRARTCAPEWRGNLGLSFDNGGFFVNANVNYQDEAYWADVLNSPSATTDAFTQVNSPSASGSSTSA